ncbi:hypothetical protein ACFE04_015024 [Oxalis oulophora]
MGDNCGSWFPQLHFDSQSHKSLTVPCIGQQETAPMNMKPILNMISTDGNSQVHANPKSLHAREGLVNEPYGWFYCLPRFRQGFTPFSNSIPKEQLPAGLYGNHVDNLVPNVGPAQKKFLVFDQSGDQTTLIFSSGVGNPVQCPHWGQKPIDAFNVNYGFSETKVGFDIQSEKLDENNETDFPSEMHEDTEELNALLYSADDSDYTEDDEDEVTSTGHSPSTMTAHDQQNGFEDVASSGGPIKKRKKPYNELPSLVDTASSIRLNRTVPCEDDAESCAIDNNKQCLAYSSGADNMKKRKIRETVSVLQQLLPVGKGEDVISVLDEAISYLKSLKHNAEALGHVSP